MYYIYFIKSRKNGKIYSGRTEKDPKKRLEEHNTGSNIWTKRNGPFDLVYFESYLCKEDSIRRELYYKTGIGKKVKKAIVEAFVDKKKPTMGV